MPPETWFDRKQAAIYLTSQGYRISAERLAKLAANRNAGRGPSFVRFGWRIVSYSKSDLDAWLNRQRQRVI